MSILSKIATGVAVHAVCAVVFGPGGPVIGEAVRGVIESVTDSSSLE